jgi:hypothetical protein
MTKLYLYEQDTGFVACVIVPQRDYYQDWWEQFMDLDVEFVFCWGVPALYGRDANTDLTDVGEARYQMEGGVPRKGSAGSDSGSKLIQAVLIVLRVAV